VRSFPSRPKSPAPRSYLYLMVDVGGCKIGVSNSPKRRRSSFWTSYVPPVVCQWYLPEGRALLMENEIKTRFAAHVVGINTEWFNVSPHDIIHTVEEVVRERFNLEPCRWYKDGTVMFWGRRPVKMSERQVKARWGNVEDYGTRADAVRGTGWTVTTAWRRFGPREKR
jgi:hypothetical protein